MRKYMKYEIKGSYKFILGIIAILIIASTLIQGNIKVGMDKAMIYGNGTPTNLAGIMMGLSVLVIFGAFVVALFYIIGSFRKELYEDRGYLTFMLPLSGNQIVGAKLIVATLWFIALGASIIIYNLILALILYGVDWLDVGKELLSMVNPGVLSLGIVSGISSILTLILIYFSIALSKVTIKNKKIGGMWFIIFLILNGLTGYIIMKMSTLVPYFLSLDGLKVLHYYELGIIPGLNNGIGDILLFGTNYGAYINIVGFLITLAMSIAAFLGTGYLIEEKIDL